MALLPQDSFKCPYLQLAPMEGIGDRSFRKAMASIGGFDEAVRDFLRVPRQAHSQSLVRDYEPEEIAPIPLAAQIMGAEPEAMAEVAFALERKGAHRIDVNCGCPSSTVTGKGAGSSLLKEPKFLHEVVQAVVRAVSIPVTVKMRSGFEDTALFQENLFAAQESGIAYLTLHPRTKVDGYGPPARWDLIAEAKSLLKIPVVGNGDILTVEDALRMLYTTRCDGLMIGRGSIMNPFLFHQIRAHFAQKTYIPRWEALSLYFDTYLATLAEAGAPVKTCGSKLKQLFSFIFKDARLLDRRQALLASSHEEPAQFLQSAKMIIEERFYASA